MSESTNARWYAIDNMGVATLCRNEADALQNAIDGDEQFPRRAPYVATQLVVLPVGWKMVPVEPTEDMIKAVYPLHYFTELSVELRRHYAEMLAAAPEPPQ